MKKQGKRIRYAGHKRVKDVKKTVRSGCKHEPDPCSYRCESYGG